VRALNQGDLRCPASGKVAYVTEERALKAIEGAWLSGRWENRHGQMASRAYECPACGWWHMTSSYQKAEG
jgi:hypothetical protein